MQHYHPIVAHLATCLLSGKITDEPPELDHYGQAHFLDLFTYRDPKHAVAKRGSSAMQPGAIGQDKTGRVSMQRGLAGTLEVALNSEAFWRQDESKVPLDLVRGNYTFFGSKRLFFGVALLPQVLVCQKQVEARESWQGAGSQGWKRPT
jgi:hypothetical protein